MILVTERLTSVPPEVKTISEAGELIISPMFFRDSFMRSLAIFPVLFWLDGFCQLSLRLFDISIATSFSNGVVAL